MHVRGLGTRLEESNLLDASIDTIIIIVFLVFAL